jgi:hypothetical protein
LVAVTWQLMSNVVELQGTGNEVTARLDYLGYGKSLYIGPMRKVVLSPGRLPKARVLLCGKAPALLEPSDSVLWLEVDRFKNLGRCTKYPASLVVLTTNTATVRVVTCSTGCSEMLCSCSTSCSEILLRCSTGAPPGVG